MKKTDKKKLINIIIGLALMLCFQFIPIKSEFITKLGMQVIGVFLGTIYLWSTVGMIWPSILAVVLLGFYGYMPMGQVLSTWMGNPVLIMIFFILVLTGAFQYHKGTDYIARFFMTMKVVEGRPWVFTFVMLLGTYIMSTFVNPWAAVFLFLPVTHKVIEEIGFKKEDTYSKLMTIAIIVAVLLGFPTAYYNGTVLGLNSTFTEASGGAYAIPGGPYMIVGLVVGILSLIAITLVMRFLIRPDVEPLKSLKVEDIQNEPLPPMNKTQKMVSAGLVLFILAMLIPAFFPNNALSKFLSANLNGVAMTIVGILAMISIDGEPVLDFPKIIANNFSWPTYFLIGTSLLLGGALTSEGVGFTAWLQNLLTPIFSNLSSMTFTIVLVLLTIAITNVMNSAVFVLISHPIILTYVNVSGVNPLPIVTLVTFAALATAAITPSASPYAATIFGQTDYVKPKDIYKYASIFVLTETIIILAVGIPLSLLILG